MEPLKPSFPSSSKGFSNSPDPFPPGYNQFPKHPIIGLPIFPEHSSLVFRTHPNAILSNEDHLFLNNIWAARSQKHLPYVLNKLQRHMSHMNEQQMISETRSLSLRPQGNTSLDAYIELERKLKAKEAEVQWREEEKKRMIEKIEELEKEKEAYKKEFLQEVAKNWEDKKTSFPLQITEVKQKVLELALLEKQEKMILVQQKLKILASKITLPEGLAISMISFSGPPHHDDPHCECEQGFYIYRASIDIDKFQEREFEGLLWTIKELFEYGFLSRLIISSTQQLHKIRMLSWRLEEIISGLLERVNNGFINLEINSTPPLFSGIPCSAKHWILIRVIHHAEPLQSANNPAGFEIAEISQLDTEERISLWRDMEITFPLTNNELEDYTLLGEETSIKIFCKHVHRFQHYHGFGSCFAKNPGRMQHLGDISAHSRIVEIGNEQSFIPQSPISPRSPLSVESEDTVTRANIENAMEP